MGVLPPFQNVPTAFGIYAYTVMNSNTSLIRRNTLARCLLHEMRRTTAPRWAGEARVNEVEVFSSDSQGMRIVWLVVWRPFGGREGQGSAPSHTPILYICHKRAPARPPHPPSKKDSEQGEGVHNQATPTHPKGMDGDGSLVT